jgi:FeS assembly SUF system protein
MTEAAVSTLPAGTPEALAESIAIVGAKVVEQLRTVHDPEIPVNIYDLGLIYSVDLQPIEDSKFNLHITMTLTTPGCPVAGSMPGMVERAAENVAEINDVKVDLVWDPPWDKSRMTDEVKLQLNMF